MARPSDEEIYEKHADALTRYAMSLVGRDEAPDVVSKAVLASISSNRWSKVRNHKAYLYRAVLNQARKTHRDRQRRWSKELRAAARRREQYETEYRPEVLEAVMKLSPRQRAATFLTYWEGLSVPEVAERIGVSQGSVKRHLARARSRLRRSFYDWEGAG